MMIRLIKSAAIALLVATAASGATLTDIQTEINTQLPTNNSQQITALKLRGVLNDILSFLGVVRPINPMKDYGAACNGSTDDHAALQAAVNAAVAQSRPLYIPGHYCANSASLTFSGTLDVFGDAAQSSIILMTTDAPAFVWTVPNEIARFDWHDFTIQKASTSTTAAIITQGGTSTSYWTHGSFRNIELSGFLYGIEINNTAGGHWNLFDAVRCTDGATTVKYCIYGPNGSGTGNIFTNFIPQMNGAGSAVIRFEGSGKNVGDIIISNGHFGNNGSVLSIGPGTVYRSRILLIGSQFDAGSVKAFDFDPTGVEYTDVRMVGNNVGGGTVTGIPANTSRSQIENMDTSVRKAGNFKLTSGAGTFSTPVFSLVFPSGRGVFVSPGPSDPLPSAGWNGTSCSVIVTGLVSGTGAAIAKSDFLVTYNNTGTPVFTAGPTSATASAWAIGHTATTDTMTISADITTPGDNRFEAQINCTGGMFALNKL